MTENILDLIQVYKGRPYARIETDKKDREEDGPEKNRQTAGAGAAFQG